MDLTTSLSGSDIDSSRNNNNNNNKWNICGRQVSRSAVVFFCQIIILYICIITCFVNLTIKNGSTELWISLLSLSLGSILPSPKVKKFSSVQTRQNNVV